jgi:hypothetical protein
MSGEVADEDKISAKLSSLASYPYPYPPPSRLCCCSLRLLLLLASGRSLVSC